MNNKDRIVLFGELLLRLTPPSNKKFLQADQFEMHWAGSEANVAVSLSCLGEKTSFVSSVPAHDLGKLGAGTLNRYGVDISGIRMEGERLGTFFYEQGSGFRNGKIIYDRNLSSFSLLKPGMINWDEVFENCGWFHWSGINAGISQDLAEVCREALKVASRKGIFISADCNHRNALWKYGKHPKDIMPALLKYSDLVVADMTVGKLYYDIDVTAGDPVPSFFKDISSKFQPNTILALTMRGKVNGRGTANDYTGYLYDGNTVFASKSHVLEDVVERIGSGDAFMAGLIYGKKNNFDPQRVIDFAAACGAIKHAITGDFNISSLDDINELLNNPRTGAILR